MLMSSSPSSSSSAASTSSFSGVKVELQQLVLAILDDPVVSRVFNEAGYCSPDIKLAVLRPPPPILRFPRSARCPPLFLCNFSPSAEDLGCSADADSCRRIGEILARPAARNPMLVGVGAAAAAADFARSIEQRSWALLPPEISGIRYVSVEGGRRIENGLEDLAREAEKPGVLVGVGDLKGLVELGDETVNRLVSEMTRVLEAYKGKVWVMGWSATYETYMKFLSRYPMLDRDWDLQLLPITSQKGSVAVAGLGGGGGLLTRPQSLMESFVPFGGFFATTYDSPSPLSKSYQSSPRCLNCNDQYQQELAAAVKEHSPPHEDPNQANLPSWMRKVDIASTTKAKDDEKVLDTKIMDLQKKWNDHCHRLHHGLLTLEANKCPVLPPIIGLPLISDRERVIHQNGLNPAVTQSQIGIGTAIPVTVGLQKISAASLSISLPLASEPIDKDLLSKLQDGVPKKEQIQTEGFQSYQSAPSGLSTHDGRTSPSSVTSVTTDLILGTLHEPSRIMETAALSKRNQYSNDFSQNSPIKKGNEFQRQLSSSSMVCQSSFQKLDTNNFKSFYRGLLEKVGRQEEAICAISSAVLKCKSGHERRRGASLKGDIWLSFHGPDRFGKKRAAAALAELVFGSREKLIYVDLGCQEGFLRTNTICGRQEIQKYDGGFRGKTVADHIVLEISKKPLSVVFLENIEKADLLVQKSLSQAIRIGKIPDSHGREFSINNAIFVASTKAGRGKVPSPKEGARFTEEMILEAQSWQLKILVEPISETICRSPKFNVSISSVQEPWNRLVQNKRKIDVSAHQTEQLEQLGMKRAHKVPATLLDLNLPVDEVVEKETDCDSTDTCGGDELWVEDFLNLVDESVNFKPFDFDALADYVLKEISSRARDVIGPECYLEIDVKVMQQILASTWLLEDIKDLNSWLNDVLCRSFIELRQRHSNKLSTHATLRFVAVEETVKEEYAPGVLLPSRIILD